VLLGFKYELLGFKNLGSFIGSVKPGGIRDCGGEPAKTLIGHRSFQGVP
jgi:hypothetical protein